MMQPIYLVDGIRTPWLKAKATNPFSAVDLAISAGQILLLRQQIEPQTIESVVMGCVMPQANEANIARIVALRLGCGHAVPAYTVQRNCASGLQAIDSAILDIQAGRYDLVLAGGVEAMSQSPMLIDPRLVRWFAQWKCSSWIQRFNLLKQFKPKALKPILSLLQGLIDPVVGLSMGQTAEVLAHRFKIARVDADRFALESHQRLAKAQDENIFEQEITPICGAGQVYEHDNGLRRDTSLEKLSRLPPVFDRPFGSVTAGNSAQITDGAALILLANERAIKRYQLPVLARVVSIHWAGVDPSEMGLGPVFSVANLLKQQKLDFQAIDYWEINEAFSAQVLACLSFFQDDKICQQYFGRCFGRIPEDRLNVDGGAIAIGHPIGATGARLVLHLANLLKRKQARRGIASLCIGGGQGGALLLERE